MDKILREILKEWDYLNNCALCKPTEVSDKAERTVWWICPNDTSHHYPMFISQRVEMAYRGREACPYCRGHRIKKRHFC
ncbi:MAG: zinc-ribbon domain-containing protein [Butyrivibrio sp.]|uniref:zinc-ribbon domain-containing protein n=1 Tax=Butyrivibrio sp. TaxID=28121 RepID=UPI001B51CDAB|nr:zinc-ribbon domain-containing protein [Butyrivibrio sp.]